MSISTTRMKWWVLGTIFSAVLMVVAGEPASCAIKSVELDDTAFGAYSHDGDHTGHEIPIEIYRTGNCFLCREEWRSFYVFDVSPVSGYNVTSASLRLDALHYASSDPFETLVLFEVGTPISELTATGKTLAQNVTVWQDLGTGTHYASRDFSAADDEQMIDIEFNADGINAINLAIDSGESFAIGGSLTTCRTCVSPGQGLADEFLFENGTLDHYINTDKQLVLQFSVQFEGDYNDDGRVTVADYSVWRDNLGAPAGTLPNDPNAGPIGAAQYATWKNSFGTPFNIETTFAVDTPEPISVALLAIGIAVAVCRRAWTR